MARPRMNGTFAPSVMSTSTSGAASAFMTTIVQSPSSRSQSRVCDPAPETEAAQKDWSAGAEGVFDPGRRL